MDKINSQQKDNYNNHILSFKKLKVGNTFKVVLCVVSEDARYQVQHQVQILFVTGLKTIRVSTTLISVRLLLEST